MATKKYPAVPEPGATVESLREAVVALKQTVELLTRQRDPAKSAVIWEELVALGIWGVTSDVIPKT